MYFLYTILAYIASAPIAYARIEQIFNRGPGSNVMFNTICGTAGIRCATGQGSGLSIIMWVARITTIFVSQLVGGLAMIALIYAGIKAIMSWGNEQGLTEAKTIAMWAIAGIALAMMGPPIIDFFENELRNVLTV
jgi:hypothetical protein